MTTEAETLVDAVRAGEMTDPGGMPTSQDIADVVTESYRTVDEKLHALDREGLLTSTTFGDERVWLVPDDDADTPVETTPDRTIPTATRDPRTT
jgi:hypothetical protein